MFRGLVTCTLLTNSTADELKEHLADKGIIHAERLMKRASGGKTLVPTETFIITYKGSSPIKQIKILFQDYNVRPYIERPIRCYNCQRFGHIRSKCNRKSVCYRCGRHHDTDVEGTSCVNPTPHCANCNGPHVASYKGCPKYKERWAANVLTSSNGVTTKTALYALRKACNGKGKTNIYDKIVAKFKKE